MAAVGRPRGDFVKCQEETYLEAVALYRTGVSLRECVRRLGLPIRWQCLRQYMVTRSHPLRDKRAARCASDLHRRRSRNAQGYIVIRVDGRRVLEHRLVAEAVLGRALMPGEIVHHINGHKNDNRPANLALMTSKEHSREHALERWRGRRP